MPPFSVVELSSSRRASFSTSATKSDSNNSNDRCTERTLLTKSRRKAQKPKQSVNFNPKVRVRKISSHRKFSQEERSKMWWSAEEFQEIRDQAIATVKKMMKKEHVDDDPNDCSRGLEFKTPKKNKIRQARKMEIIWTVLSEQEAKEEWGNKSDLIAEIYIACSRSCIDEATSRGAMDAIHAWS